MKYTLGFVTFMAACMQPAQEASTEQAGTTNGYIWGDVATIVEGKRNYRPECPAQVCDMIAPKDDMCCAGMLGCQELAPECVPDHGMCITYLCPLTDGTVARPGLCAP